MTWDFDNVCDYCYEAPCRCALRKEEAIKMISGMTDQQLWSHLLWANDPGHYHPDESPNPWDTASTVADARPSMTGWINYDWTQTDLTEARARLNTD